MKQKISTKEDIQHRLQMIVDAVEAGNITKFAKNCGINPSTMHNYIQGRSPSVDVIIRICGAYGVNHKWLLTGDGPQFKNQFDTVMQSNGNEYLKNIHARDIGVNNGSITITSGHNIGKDRSPEIMRLLTFIICIAKIIEKQQKGA